MKSAIFTSIVTAVSILLMSIVHAQTPPTQIRIVTQGFAPLQWDNNGSPDGYVAEYMLSVIEQVNQIAPVSVKAFEFLPWKRAMLIAETVPDVLFFSLSRTMAREDKFHWLGEVSPYGQNFYQLRSRPRIDVDRIEDLRNLDIKIGVQDGSNLHTYLNQLEFEETGNLVPITDYHQGIEMLYLERIDLLPLTGFLAEASACKQGFNGSMLEPVIHIEALARPLWAVFSKKTDPELVEIFQKEMVKLKQNGLWEDRMNQHRENWQKLACANDVSLNSENGK
ncbi:Bacterial extracellular solute-binding proteins, family 3 [Roseibium album]|nr:Bacterial extracellular solute-binding proteins, family 3 [Roseibium album]